MDPFWATFAQHIPQNYLWNTPYILAMIFVGWEDRPSRLKWFDCRANLISGTSYASNTNNAFLAPFTDITAMPFRDHTDYPIPNISDRVWSENQVTIVKRPLQYKHLMNMEESNMAERSNPFLIFDKPTCYKFWPGIDTISTFVEKGLWQLPTCFCTGS